MFKVFIITLTIFFAACSSLQVVEVNTETGYFPGTKKAVLVKSVEINLDSINRVVLVPNGDFTSNMVKNIGFFNEVITFDDLEKIIIKNDLTDQVPSVENQIGINKAAKAYKHFLWISWDSRRDGRKVYKQLKLTDPITLEDIFVCETVLDYTWAGVNDQSNWYPMMNSLIDYLKNNSKTFRNSHSKSS